MKAKRTSDIQYQIDCLVVKSKAAFEKYDNEPDKTKRAVYLKKVRRLTAQADHLREAFPIF